MTTANTVALALVRSFSVEDSCCLRWKDASMVVLVSSTRRFVETATAPGTVALAVVDGSAATLVVVVVVGLVLVVRVVVVVSSGGAEVTVTVMSCSSSSCGVASWSCGGSFSSNEEESED